MLVIYNTETGEIVDCLSGGAQVSGLNPDYTATEYPDATGEETNISELE